MGPALRVSLRIVRIARDFGHTEMKRKLLRVCSVIGRGEAFQLLCILNNSRISEAHVREYFFSDRWLVIYSCMLDLERRDEIHRCS